MLAFGFLQMVMGAGLLKLNPWARTMTIIYFSFFFLNSISIAVVPGTQMRFEEAMTEMRKIFGTYPTPMPFPMWFGLLPGLPLFLAVLWFLIKRREAFLPEAEGVAPLG